jgi:hypothetical protein
VRRRLRAYMVLGVKRSTYGRGFRDNSSRGNINAIIIITVPKALDGKQPIVVLHKVAWLKINQIYEL